MKLQIKPLNAQTYIYGNVWTIAVYFIIQSVTGPLEGKCLFLFWTKKCISILIAKARTFSRPTKAEVFFETGASKKHTKTLKNNSKWVHFSVKVAGCRPVTLLEINSFKGSFKYFANIKSYFFRRFYSSGTASCKEHIIVAASVATYV